MNVSSGLNI